MKRVLIITYYWPPCGGIAVLRCLKFAKYLRQFGWEPLIYTAEDAHYPFIDHSNDQDIPQNLEVIRGKIWEPYSLYKAFTGQESDANVNNIFYTSEEQTGIKHKLSVWIRSNFFIPDARAKWINPSVKLLSKYIQEHKIDAILSNGPPHSNTRIATLLSKKTGIPWLADFQDPWSQVDYYQMLHLTKSGEAKHLSMEQEAFHQASKTTIVSKTWKKNLEEIGAENVSVIPWGYDPDDYTKFSSITIDQNFGFTHVGIMGHDRNPSIFFKVLKSMCDQNTKLSDELSLNLIGQVDHSIVREIEDHGLSSCSNYIGTVSRDEALRRTMSSPVLLLLLNQQDNAEGRIPGKLFEYLASKRPILALGPAQSDVKEIIESSRAGYYCAYEDTIGIQKTVNRLYTAFQDKSLLNPMNSQIEQYSTYNTTKKIASLLDEITSL